MWCLRSPKLGNKTAALIGKFAFERVVVFVGVTAAFVLENWRERAAEAKYHAARSRRCDHR